MHNFLASLIDMTKYAGLMQGFGNPLLSLMAYTDVGRCAWSSNEHFPDVAWQKIIDAKISCHLADEMSPAITRSEHEGFNLTVLNISEPNRAKLIAIVLVEELPISNGVVAPASLRKTEHTEAFLASIESLLLNELSQTSVTRLPVKPAVVGGGEIALLNTVNARARQYLQDQSNARTEQTLLSVLTDCTLQPNVDMAVLYLKEENVLLIAPEACHNDIGSAPLLRAIRKDILLFDPNSTTSRLKLGEEISVQSENPPVLGSSLDILASHDRLIIPIPDAMGRVMGLLGFIRSKSTEATFSPADQALIELLALPIEQVVNAKYDTATGLLNAEGFYPRLGDLLRSTELDDHESCLLYIRFGQLISIGDNCGSAALNEAVVQLGAILEKRIRKRDLAARTASSDFLLYLNKCSAEDAEALCEELLDTLKGYRFSYKSKLFSINAYIGVVPMARVERDVASLLNAGEDACVDAMNQGNNGFCVYQPKQKVANRSNGLIVWSDRIVEILRDEKLHLYTQAVVSLSDLKSIDHHEVLLRVKSDNSLLVAPSVFVRVAERSRLIEQVDYWVIRNAFENLNKIYSDNPHASTTLSINISGSTINESFPDFISELMEDMAFQSDAVMFELTEASAVSNMKHIVKAVKQMRLHGYRFSLDDFGAGMGSFVFLQNLGVDRIKIDGALVRGINRSEVNQAIVQAIQSVSEKMALQTTAKLVDDSALLDSLKAIGVDFVQGHLVSRAVPIDQLVNPVVSNSKGLGG